MKKTTKIAGLTALAGALVILVGVIVSAQQKQNAWMNWLYAGEDAPRVETDSCEVLDVETIELDLPEDIGHVERVALEGDVLYFTAEMNSGGISLWSYSARGYEELLNLENANRNSFIDIDNLGNLYFRTDYPHQMYRSTDSGKTWQDLSTVTEDIFFSVVADTSDSTVLYAGNWSADGNSPVVYKSTDSGETWSLWLNVWDVFPEGEEKYDETDDRRKIRHIHDIYVDGEFILLGVGDVEGMTYVSNDGGESWDAVYGNGFTGHASIAPDKIVLAGDSREPFGLQTFYRKIGGVERVWDNNACDWSGYTLSMAQNDFGMFAAQQIEHAYEQWYGVLYSPNGEDWAPVIKRWSNGGEDHITSYVAADGRAMFASVAGVLYKIEFNQ